MNLLLAIAIWIGISAICAPLIGSFLSGIDGSLSMIGPEHRPPRNVQRHFARRQMTPSSWSRRTLRPSRVS